MRTADSFHASHYKPRGNRVQMMSCEASMDDMDATRDRSSPSLGARKVWWGGVRVATGMGRRTVSRQAIEHWAPRAACTGREIPACERRRGFARARRRGFARARGGEGFVRAPRRWGTGVVVSKRGSNGPLSPPAAQAFTAFPFPNTFVEPRSGFRNSTHYTIRTPDSEGRRAFQTTSLNVASQSMRSNYVLRRHATSVWHENLSQ